MTRPRLFDAHAHLSGSARPEPGGRRVLCGTSEADWPALLARAADEAGSIPMLGLHPWRVAEARPGWAARLESLLRSQRAGIGECGLDFSRKEPDRASQLAALSVQLRLARDLRRPVALHAVRAWGPLLEALRSEGVPTAGAMVHAYGGSPETALILQDLGVFLSFSGELLRSDRPGRREALRAVRDDRLLLETDGRADLTQVIARAAELRATTVEDLAALTWENGLRCFRELLA